MPASEPRPKSLIKWLIPGIRVKRWLLLVMFGGMVFGLGIAMFLLEAYRTFSLPGVSILTLGGTSLWVRSGIASVLGIVVLLLGIIRLNRSLMEPMILRGENLIDTMVTHRRLERGPRIVAVGGGTGLPTLLRGLKAYTSNITAIVTVADDGGSSGRLRRDLGVLPPGDFRNNIAALARDEGLMTQLFQYRFGEGGLEGHSFGNLFITALSGVTGSFERALIESSRVLAIQGRVLPSTTADVTLIAERREAATNSTRRVTGESAIPHTSGVIERIFLQPDNVPPYPEAVKAILAADLIVLGPGSLFTSILPNLLVKGIASAIRASQAKKVYVCNVATQTGETDGFDVADHVQAIEAQAGRGLFSVVLANDNLPELASGTNFEYVQLPSSDKRLPKIALITNSLVDETHNWRHDPDLLAKAVIGQLGQTNGKI